MFDLPMIWAGLIAFAVFAYVVLDGFDLGIGILFPFLRVGEERDLAMNSVAPVWDGNETWLVLGGGGLFAAFPLAFAVIMPAVYAPLTAMLLGLVFRGVAFEFRWRDPDHRRWWDVGFAGGSIMAAFAQGVVLGTFIQGIEVEGRAYGGGWFGWLTPFSLTTGLALVLGYGLLGASWLILKTEGDVRDHAYRFAGWLALAVFAMVAAVSLWSPLLHPDIEARWFDWPNVAYLSPVPLLTLALAAGLYWSLKKRRDRLPFPLSLSLFALSYAGLGISLFPYVVPRAVTVWDAAAPDASLGFMLIGAAILLPIILAYTGYAYWVFRGKLDPKEGYH